MLTPTRRVLVVEDTPIVAEVAGSLLRAAGYRVDVVVDGLRAVAAVQDGAYDIVLMDCQLPGMIDGYEATRRIRELERTGALGARRLPILAFTAHVSDEDHDRARDAGMDDSVGKPVDARDLIAIVGRYTAR